MGLFLCCDRWGPPSEAEAKNGMPYHGEATKVVWEVQKNIETTSAAINVRMAAELPLAGLRIDRSVTLASASVVTLTEPATFTRIIGTISRASTTMPSGNRRQGLCRRRRSGNMSAIGWRGEGFVFRFL